MKLIRILLTISILLLFSEAFAQQSVLGSLYMKPQDIISHGGNKQVFDAIADKNGVIYFANAGSGITIYDGTSWESLPLPGQASAKSLCINDETDSIYVGAGGDMGVLRVASNGSYEFASLKDMIPEECHSSVDISSILYSKKEGMVFMSTDYLYVLKDNTIKAISGKTNIHAGYVRIFKCGDRIFAVHKTNGIKEIVNGEEISHPEMDRAGQGEGILDIFECDGKIRIISLTSGITEVDGEKIVEVSPEFSKLIRETCQNDDKVLQTSSGYFVFIIRSAGLVVTDSQFNIRKSENFKTKTYKLYEDKSQAIWICADGDVLRLDIFYPYKEYPNSETKIQGTIRTSYRRGDSLYIGADAVYSTSIQSLDSAAFCELKNDKGYTSMWSLDTIAGGEIIGGSNKGLFSIDRNGLLHNIDKADEYRNIFKHKQAQDNPDILIGIGGLSGFSVYQKTGGAWSYKVGADAGPDNFQKKSRYIEEGEEPGCYWVSDKSSGVYRIKFNSTYDTVASAELFDETKGLPSSIGNFVFQSDRGMVVATDNGLYKYDKESGRMVEDTRLNKIFGGKKKFILMYYDSDSSFWVKHVLDNGKSKNEEILLEQYRLTGDSAAKCISSKYNIFKGDVFSFGSIGGGKYIIGGITSFTIYNSKTSKDFEAPYKALVRKMESISYDTLLYGGQPGKIVLPYKYRSVRITFSSAFYDCPEKTMFSTYLENSNDDWSAFRSENYKEYPNLWPGTYTMHVIARNCYGILSEEGTFTFEILPPWYLTIWAYILYLLLLALLVWGIVRGYTQKLIRDKEKLEQLVEERTSEIRKQSLLIMDQNKEIVEKNKSITDSINYAKHIQKAMLPLPEKITAGLAEHFILFRPKDIVSGDYYWFAETEKHIIITAADCTGHGVPGAFMSMIGSQILTEIVAEGITSPDEILTHQNRRIRKALKQDTTENHDGMDMALCTIYKDTHKVEFAGAKNQLIVIKNGELKEYKADKQSIGGSQMYGDDFQYQKTAIEPDGNTWFYMFSDGYKDQFGGPENSKFLIKRLRQLLMDIHEKPPQEQERILDATIQNWIDTGHGEQTDDIILIGFKL